MTETEMDFEKAELFNIIEDKRMKELKCFRMCFRLKVEDAIDYAVLHENNPHSKASNLHVPKPQDADKRQKTIVQFI